MKRMSRSIPLVCFVALAAGCSGATHAAEQPSPTATSSSTTATKPAVRAAIRNLPPVAKLTAACTLLSAAELKTLLVSGTSKTRVTATEDKPPSPNIHVCKYGSHGKDPFELVVGGFTQKGFTPKMAIDAIVKQHLQDKTRIRSVSGVGEVAAFLTFKDGISELMGSKRSHGQTRLVGFEAPAVVPERKFVDVAKLVINRV
jgi:hypothetical protein